MSTLAQIVDAVTDDLNAKAFSLPFEAERMYRPRFELPEMKELHVTVVPASIELTTASRSLVQIDYTIDVAVQKRFEKDGPTELDSLMALVEEIIDFFRMRRPAGQDAVCVRAANEPIYSQDHMDQFRQFTSVVTLTFRVLR